MSSRQFGFPRDLEAGMISQEVWVDVMSLRRQGKAIRQIARELGLSRNTVRRYLRGQGPPRYQRGGRGSVLDPYKGYLQARLGEKPELSAPVLLREIRALGYGGQLTILKDFLRPLRVEQRRLRELTVRFETAPGEQMQVDWSGFGRLPGGEKLYGLVSVLSWSRMLFVYFTTRMVLQELLYGLVLAFEYFGGLVQKLLLDNARTVVLRRGSSVADSQLHPRFLDFLGHYGLQLQLCRLGRARTKGKVERPMPYLWNSFVYPNLERYTTAAEWNQAARLWLDEVANVRVHGTTGERPVDRWPREGLLPLGAVRPYDLSWSEPRRVHKDCHFSWEGNRYSVPWAYGGLAVMVRRKPAGRLEVERDGQLIAVHRERPRGQGETVTLPEHLASLWARTLGPRSKPGAPGPEERSELFSAVPFPQLAVEERSLSVYQALLEEEVAR